MRVVVRHMVEADLPELTRLHQEAFAGYMNVRLGGTYVSRFLDWFRRHDEHIALAAVLEKRAVGYVIGAGEGYLRNLNRDLAGVVALGILRHPWVLARADIRKALRSRAQALLVPAAPSAAERNDCIELVGIGVSSSAQGEGVGHALM